MALHIVIDARRIRDFGIGTYIRNLVQALGEIDHDQPVHAGELRRTTRACWPALPENFQSPSMRAATTARWITLRFPLFLRGLSPDLVHIPLNRVPLLMPRPYVVTIHDMASLLFDEETSSLRMQLRRYRFRRGLQRAEPRDRRLGRHAARCGEPDGRAAGPHPRWSTTRPIRRFCAQRPMRACGPSERSSSASWSAIRSTIRSCCTPGNIRPAEEHPAAGGGLRGGARAAGGASRCTRTCG